MAHNRNSMTSQVFEAFLKNRRSICSLLRRRFGNSPDVDDLSQEVFLRAMKAAHEKEIHNPRAFLFGVTRKLVLAEMARRSSSLIDLIEDIAPQTDIIQERPADRIAEAEEEWREFAEAVAALPPRCRKVFVLKKVYGNSNKEVAAELDISTSTVEKHIAAALRRIGEHIAARHERVAPVELRGEPGSSEPRRKAKAVS